MWRTNKWSRKRSLIRRNQRSGRHKKTSKNKTHACKVVGICDYIRWYNRWRLASTLFFYVDYEPVNVDEALKDSKSIKAMNEELKSIGVNNTWSLVEFPQGKKAIDVKWINKVKMNPKEEVTWHKTRLVAKGFLQKKGIDFDEVFTLVARIEIIKLVVGLAEMNSWHIC